MSLLNDALRAAEERQRRPDVTGAYTGGSVQGGRGGSHWLVIFVLLLVLLFAGAGIYWFTLRDQSTPIITNTDVVSGTENGTVQRSEADPVSETPELLPVVENASDPVEQALPAEGAEDRQQRVLAPEPEPKIEPEPQIRPEADPTPPVTVADSSQMGNSEPVTPEPAPEPEPLQTTEAAEPPPLEEEPPQNAPVVKTTPQSPAAIDRKVAKELEGLASDGRLVEAERRLNGLVQTQAAPQSRFVLARALLVQGEHNRALNWLPETIAAGDAALRMLRARAQHADGQLDAAVATLQSRVPAIADQPEYRVTLATLLQQQGQVGEAARHWAELIAWDDSRAPWWVGLAIALEDQGEVRSAARAYEQAAALPGLPPSLADYVQRRLRSLRAG